VKKEVEQALDLQIENIVRQAGGKKEAEKMLQQSIKSFRSEFWYEMKDKIISEKFQQKVLSKIKVSKKDVFSFFENYKDSLPLFPMEVKIRHLLITPEASDSAKKETIFLLKTIKDKIKKGEAFEKMASSFSMDPGSKKKGGDLGWVKRGSLLKNFEETAFTIKTNTISEPIETEVGYHILEVFERKGDRARVRHILIAPQITTKDEKRAFEFASSLKDSCSSLTLFKTYTKKYSKDPPPSQIGGDLWLKRSKNVSN
jgi:Parvulin-like peptidyl-prolyl isomerase